MIGLIAATANGRRKAAHLARAWPDGCLYEGKAKEVLYRAWNECEGIVLFLATGAAVRLIAPLLESKHQDPGVVTVDDAGNYVVALCGGHEGGANALAARVADALGGTAVITTASDSVGVPALDSLGEKPGLRLESGSDLASVAAALVSGEKVGLVMDRRYPIGPLPENVVRTEVWKVPLILISDRLVETPRPAVVYRPPSLVAGVGCTRGARADEILDLLRRSLAEAELTEKSVTALSSIDVKRNEAGLLQAAEKLEVQIHFHPAEALSVVETPNPSGVVREAVGTPSVAEASVISSGAELILEKRRSAHATVAVGRLPVRGRLALVSLGPGEEDLIPPLAREALVTSELVIGLDQYVDRIRHLLRPGTRVLTPPLGNEMERAELALAETRTGGSTALVSSGDVGVYAMASPVLELAGEEVDVVVVPGVTAAQAAASLLGSPLGHDHCSVSLSDLLTPWGVIESRVRAAAEGDFVVSLYNPRSKGRDWQLGKVKEILLGHRPPDTPVGIVKDAYRPTQQIILTNLAALRPEDVDMLTIVLVGSSRTRVVAGRMVTPRGYLS